MAGWLAKKGQNSRVRMCIKSFKWELSAADNVKRATFLALSQYLRNELFDGVELNNDILDRPFDYSRDDLFTVYDILETVRNNNERQIKVTKNNMQRLGMELPQFSIEHAKTTGTSWEVWMCTLGAGILPELRDDVRTIWSYLEDSIEYAGEAILQLRQIEKKTASMTGVSDSGMFSSIDSDDWIELCKFIPSVFLKKYKFT